MKHRYLNIIIGVIGLILILTGLIFRRYDVVAVPLTGVGGSVFATALVNWLLSRHLEIIPIHSIIEALAQKVQFMRTKQEVELIFTLEEDKIRLEKRHKYHLINPNKYPRSRTVSMFTDASSATKNDFGGFILITEVT